MKARHERQVLQLQDQITQLEKDLADRIRAVEHAEVALGEEPRWRDRNRFFHEMLNGEVVKYERMAPQWRELRRGRREVRRIRRRLGINKARHGRAVRRGLERGDPEYRRLLAKSNWEKTCAQSCERVLESIGAARKRINRVSGRRPRDEDSRSVADQDASEVADRIRAVRSRAAELNAKIPQYGSLEPVGLVNLSADIPTDHTLRVQKYKDIKDQLDVMEKHVKSWLREFEAKERTIESQRRQYLEKEQARFTQRPSPPS